MGSAAHHNLRDIPCPPAPRGAAFGVRPGIARARPTKSRLLLDLKSSALLGMLPFIGMTLGSLAGAPRSQLFASRNTLWIACGVLVSLALVPGLPKLSFLLLAAGLGVMARTLPVRTAEATEGAAEVAGAGVAAR